MRASDGTARAAAVLSVLACASAASVSAQGTESWRELSAPEDRAGDIAWNEAWPEFRPWEYVLTGSLLIAAPYLGSLDGPATPYWRGGILFDDFASDYLVVEDRDTRERLAVISDYLWYGTQLFPLVVDAVLVAGIVRREFAIAVQLALIDLEAMLLTGLVSRLLHVIVGRDRPTATRCALDPDYDASCSATRSRNAGFYSGHTALAFTGAGLTCAHHAALDLYGGGVADAMACAGTLLAATAVGALRQLTNRHYLTDILVGAAVGFAIGYGLPMLLHFNESDEWEDDPIEEPGAVIAVPYFAGTGGGAEVVGAF